jgi:hypothetical protein
VEPTQSLHPVATRDRSWPLTPLIA